MRIVSNAYRHKKQSLVLIMTVIVMSVLIFVSVAAKASNEYELKALYNSMDVRASMMFKRGDGYATYEYDTLETDMAIRVLRAKEFIEDYNFTKLVDVNCAPVSERDTMYANPPIKLYGLTSFQMLEGYYDGAVTFIDGYSFDDFLVTTSTTYQKIVLLREELADSLGVKPGDTVSIMQALGFQPSDVEMRRSCYDALVVGLHALGAELEGAFDIVVPADFAVKINYSSYWSGMSRYDNARYKLQNLDRLDEFKDFIIPSGILHKYRFIIYDDDLRLMQDSLNDALSFINMALAAEYYLTIVIAFVISFILLKTRIQEIALSRAIGESVVRIFIKLLLEFSFVCLVGSIIGCAAGTLLSWFNMSGSPINLLDVLLSNVYFLLSFAAGSVISLLTAINIKPIEILTRKE